MKKIFLSLITVLTFSTAWSQTEIKINPLGLLFGSPDISAEFGINESTGIEPFVGINFGNISVGSVTYKSSGFRLGGIGKYYFNTSKGLDKFWAGLYLRGGSGSSTTSSTTGGSTSTAKIDNTRLAAGLAIGYKWVSSRNIVFELGFGVGRAFIDKSTVSSGTADAESFSIPYDFLGRLQLGYRFGGK